LSWQPGQPTQTHLPALAKRPLNKDYSPSPQTLGNSCTNTAPGKLVLLTHASVQPGLTGRHHPPVACCVCAPAGSLAVLLHLAGAPTATGQTCLAVTRLGRLCRVGWLRPAPQRLGEAEEA
jgi:hypothetical protein